MPDYWTHTLTIKEIAARIRRDSDYLFLGTHGPDPLFYVNQLNLFHRTKLAKVGNRLHEDHIRDLFRFLFAHSKTAEEPTVEYLAGFIAHYVVDAACHPFVYARTKTSAEHKYLELHIDRYVVEHVFHMDPSPASLRPWIRYVPSDAFRRYIAPFYLEACKQLHGIEIDIRDIEHAGEDIGKAVKLSLSRFAKKIPFKPLISKLVGIDVNLMIQPEQADPSIDYDEFVALLNPARERAFEAVQDYLSIARTATPTQVEEFLERYVHWDFNGTPLS